MLAHTDVLYGVLIVSPLKKDLDILLPLSMIIQEYMAILENKIREEGEKFLSQMINLLHILNVDTM